MQNNSRMLKEGTEEVRRGFERVSTSRRCSKRSKYKSTKGKPVVGIRRMGLGREDNPTDRQKRVCDGDPASKVKITDQRV
jgi:hypothetical protein